ncbi:MAG: hypothetical protein WBD88_10875, partial [Mycobacterium sp.]
PRPAGAPPPTLIRVRVRPSVLGAVAESLDAAEPVEPAEPLLSANAIGIDASAEPTPRAIANAPTRPT